MYISINGAFKKHYPYQKKLRTEQKENLKIHIYVNKNSKNNLSYRYSWGTISWELMQGVRFYSILGQVLIF